MIYCRKLLDHIIVSVILSIQRSPLTVSPFITNHKRQFLSIMKLFKIRLTSLPLVSVPGGVIEWQERALIKNEVKRTCEKKIFIENHDSVYYQLSLNLDTNEISIEYDHNHWEFEQRDYHTAYGYIPVGICLIWWLVVFVTFHQHFCFFNENAHLERKI